MAVLYRLQAGHRAKEHDFLFHLHPNEGETYCHFEKKDYSQWIFITLNERLDGRRHENGSPQKKAYLILIGHQRPQVLLKCQSINLGYQKYWFPRTNTSPPTFTPPDSLL